MAWLYKSCEGYTNVPDMFLQLLWCLLRRYVCIASFNASSASHSTLLGCEAEDSRAAFVLSSVPYTQPSFSSPVSLIQPHLYLYSHYSSFVKIFCSCQPYSSWSLLIHREMNHDRKDHRLAQRTDSIFLFLSSFRWCLGNTATSSISSKDWSEV